jgi:hypothetical protein
MPGVLIIEAMAQVGGILAYLASNEEIRKKVCYFVAIDNGHRLILGGFGGGECIRIEPPAGRETRERGRDQSPAVRWIEEREIRGERTARQTRRMRADLAGTVGSLTF